MDYSWCVLKIAAVDENALHECGILCWKVSMLSQSALAPPNWHTDVPQRQLYGWRSRHVITKSGRPTKTGGKKKKTLNDLHQINNSPNVLLERIDRPLEKISLGPTTGEMKIKQHGRDFLHQWFSVTFRKIYFWVTFYPRYHRKKHIVGLRRNESQSVGGVNK